MHLVASEAWKSRLRQYLHERCGEERNQIPAGDFPRGQSVLIRFPDGSYAHFHDAFAVRDEQAGEVAVFTEHCGYQRFPAPWDRGRGAPIVRDAARVRHLTTMDSCRPDRAFLEPRETRDGTLLASRF